MPALSAKRCRQDACAPSEKMQARCLRSQRKDAGKMPALSAKKMQTRCLRSQRGRMPALPADELSRQDACAPNSRFKPCAAVGPVLWTVTQPRSYWIVFYIPNSGCEMSRITNVTVV